MSDKLKPYPYLYAQGKEWAPKAELDNLVEQANRTAGIYEKEIDMLRAEVERLRAAVTDLGVAHIAAVSKACPRCGYDRTQEP